MAATRGTGFVLLLFHEHRCTLGGEIPTQAHSDNISVVAISSSVSFPVSQSGELFETFQFCVPSFFRHDSPSIHHIRFSGFFFGSWVLGHLPSMGISRAMVSS